MKNGIVIIIIILAILLPGFYLLKSDSASQETIKIGGVYALISIGAAIGEEINKGAELAIEEINANGGVNGQKIELVTEDLSMDRLKEANSVVQRMKNIHKVKAIVGAQWDEPNEAMLPFVEKEEIVTISPDTTDYLLSRNESYYFMSTWFNNKVGVDEILRYARDNDIKSITVLRFFDSGFWKYVGDYLESEAQKYGVEIVDNVVINAFAPNFDYRTHISKIIEKNPDAIFSGISSPVTCPFMKQLGELGYEGKFLATESAGNIDSLETCPELLEDRLFFSHPVQTHERYLDFVESFKNKYGYEPVTPSTVTAYDAVYLLAEGLRATNGEGGEALRLALKEIKDFEGASQPVLNFKENGFVETPEDIFKMKTIRDGEFVLVE